jgi:hypothetical protein
VTASVWRQLLFPGSGLRSGRKQAILQGAHQPGVEGGSIVPISRSAADQIQALRRQASGRFLSASASGLFTTVEGSSSVNCGRRVLRPELG